VRRHGEPRALDFEPKPHWDQRHGVGISSRARREGRARASRADVTGRTGSRVRSSNSSRAPTRARTAYTDVEPRFIVNADALRGHGNCPSSSRTSFKPAGDWDLFLIPEPRKYRDQSVTAARSRWPRELR